MAKRGRPRKGVSPTDVGHALNDYEEAYKRACMEEFNPAAAGGDVQMAWRSALTAKGVLISAVSSLYERERSLKRIVDNLRDASYRLNKENRLLAEMVLESRQQIRHLRGDTDESNDNDNKEMAQ